jgi:hypothetical protein
MRGAGVIYRTLARAEIRIVRLDSRCFALRYMPAVHARIRGQRDRHQWAERGDGAAEGSGGWDEYD